MCLSNVSHLVWAAPALLDQDLHHIRMVFSGSHVYWKSTTVLRQQWVSPVLQKFFHKGRVACLSLAGEVERRESCSVP